MIRSIFLSLAFVVSLGMITKGVIHIKNNNTPDKVNSRATVQEWQGLKIFILSKPTAPYTVLGTVKQPAMHLEDDVISPVNVGGPYYLLNILSTDARLNYPTGQGLVIDSIDFKQAQVIKF